MKVDRTGGHYSFIKFRHPGGVRRALLAGSCSGGLGASDNDTMLRIRPRAPSNLVVQPMSSLDPESGKGLLGEAVGVKLDKQVKNQDKHKGYQCYEKKGRYKYYDQNTQQPDDVDLEMQCQSSPVLRDQTETQLPTPIVTGPQHHPQADPTSLPHKMGLPATPAPSKGPGSPAIPFRTVLVSNVPKAWSAQDLYQHYHDTCYYYNYSAGGLASDDQFSPGMVPGPAASPEPQQRMIVVGVFLYADGQGLVEFGDHAMAYLVCIGGTRVAAGVDGPQQPFTLGPAVPTDIWSLDAWLGGVQMRSGPVIQAYE